jgi:hypothetical protein
MAIVSNEIILIETEQKEAKVCIYMACVPPIQGGPA